MMRFILAVLFLGLAFVMQFWFASLGIFINFVFAALISLACLFDLWDLIFFILLAIFVINWQPTWSPELILLAAIPLVAYWLHKRLTWEAWALNASALIIGFIIFYIVLAPTQFLPNIRIFFIDLVASFIFGNIIFAALNRREGR